jgi:hypothetical protein
MKKLIELFDPKKNKDINAELLNMRANRKLLYSSELGILSALNDAKTTNAKILLINKKTKARPLLGGFSKMRKKR